MPTTTQHPQLSTAPELDMSAAPTGLPQIDDPGKIAPKDARKLAVLFFDQLQVLEEGTHEYQYARNTLIEMNLSLVHFAAKRFRNRGSGEMEDIIQVGTIGLIKAIDRFELSREVEFTSFAIPYIVGEIKRFFRDSTWAVHVPRRLQELRVTLAKTREALSTRLDREPTVAELAQHLELTEEEVIEGLIAANGYTAGSLDRPSARTRTAPRRSPTVTSRGRRPGHGTGRGSARPGSAAGAAGRTGAGDRRDAVRPGDDTGPDRRAPRHLSRCMSPGCCPGCSQSSASDMLTEK